MCFILSFKSALLTDDSKVVLTIKSISGKVSAGNPPTGGGRESGVRGALQKKEGLPENRSERTSAEEKK